MSMTTREERLTKLDEKIAATEAKLEELREKREKLTHPVSMRSVLSAAKTAGISPRDAADMLGLDM